MMYINMIFYLLYKYNNNLFLVEEKKEIIGSNLKAIRPTNKPLNLIKAIRIEYINNRPKIINTKY